MTDSKFLILDVAEQLKKPFDYDSFLAFYHSNNCNINIGVTDRTIERNIRKLVSECYLIKINGSFILNNKHTRGGNMVSTAEALESQYISSDLIINSPTKKLVVVGAGSYEETKFGKRLTLNVSIDGKIKIWRPNKETVRNLIIYGNDTAQWLSRTVSLSVEERNGKQTVIGKPDGITSEQVIKALEQPAVVAQ